MDYFNLDSDSSIEAATVNGWLAEISGTIPQVGYTLEYKNLVITVTKADDVMAHEIFVEIK